MEGRTTERLDGILDLVQESVLVRDLRGRILQCNRAFERLYGWSADKAAGHSAHTLLRTHHLDTIEAIEARLLEVGAWQGEVVRFAADGAKVVVEARWTLRRDNIGRPLDVLETDVDVTARRRTEDALRRAEHRYSNVFQAMAVSFWEIDFTVVGTMLAELRQAGVTDLARHFDAHPEFVRAMIRAARIIDVNAQSVATFGRGDKQEMLASLEPYWPMGSTAIFAESVVAAMEGKPHYTAETRFSALDGQEYEVLFTACFPPEMLTRGKVLVGNIDITAANRAKRELELREQRYRSLFHLVPVALVQLDRTELAREFGELHASGVSDLTQYIDAHPDFLQHALGSIKISEVNQRTVELFAAPSTEALTGPAARLWTENPDVFRKSMAARFAGAERYEAEIKIRTFDDRILDVLYITDFPEAVSDYALGLACLVDITERAKAQTALAHLRAEFAHAARVSTLGELTASIAHEINQPLAAIATNGEAGLRWMNRSEPDLGEVRALMQRTVADAGRAADIIRRIRAMAGGTAPERTPSRLNEIVEESLLFLHHELQRHEVEPKLILAPDLPEVMIDRVQVQQVVVNLALNAAQAMSVIRPDRRRLTVMTATAAGEVTVEVADSGVGLPEGQIERVFDSFYTTKANGLGVGLAICRSIVEAHGGRIWAASRPEGGASFTFALPSA